MSRSHLRPWMAAVFVLLISAATSRAALLAPYGNPPYNNSPANDPAGSAYLNPLPASYRVAGDCPWVIPALQAQGFTKANNWTINTQALVGDIELDVYMPWTNLRPGFTQGTIVRPSANVPGQGGAAIGLGYDPDPSAGSNDPSGVGVHWLQVIHTNNPLDLAWAQANGVNAGGGYYNYIDDQGNPAFDPYYDTQAAANTTDFVDRPSRNLGTNIDWQAQVFIATETLNNPLDRSQGGTLTLYDGVWWGFTLVAPVPEPASILLAGCGLGCLVVVAWRNRSGRN